MPGVYGDVGIDLDMSGRGADGSSLGGGDLAIYAPMTTRIGGGEGRGGASNECYPGYGTMHTGL